MASLRDLDPRARPIVAEFLRLLAQAGVRATITSTRRDPAKQKKLWDCYQRVGCSDCTKRPGQRGCYPAAPPGKSTHAVGAAFDVHLDPPVYAEAGKVWEEFYGFTWGGRFSDPIHFDFRPYGRA